MRNPLDPFADIRHLFHSLDETRRLIEATDPLRSLREIQAQMKAFQPLVTAPQFRELALQPVLPTRMLAQLTEISTVGQQIFNLLPDTNALRQLGDTAEMARTWLRELGSGADFSRTLGELQGNLRNGLLQPLPAVADQLAALNSEVVASFSALGESFAARIAQSISRIVASESPDDLEESVTSTGQILIDQAERVTPGRLSREALLSILLTLILFALDQATTFHTASQIGELLHNIQERLLERIESVATPVTEDQQVMFWFVLEPLEVREEATDEARHLGFVYPGRRVKLLESAGDWVRIEYFNDTNGQLAQGWVRKHGLQEFRDTSQGQVDSSHPLRHESHPVLSQFVQAAMAQARYEFLAEDNVYYGDIDGFNGVYATASRLEACREELQEVLEEWILLRVSRNLPLPTVGGIELMISKAS